MDKKRIPKSPKHSIIDCDNFFDRQELKINNDIDIPVKLILSFGYFYRGYSKNRYYWEIVMFSRKFLLIFIGVFTEFFPKNSKATVFLVVINLYMYIHVLYKPFKFEYLNRLESYSLFVCCVTGIIGILLFSEKIKSASLFLVILVALFNIGYISFWIYQFIKYAVGRKKARHFRRKFLFCIKCCRRKKPKNKKIL